MPESLFLRDSGTSVFPVNFAKFLRTPFLQNTFGRLLLNILLNSRTAPLRECLFYKASTCKLATLSKKETPAQMLSCDFCKILRLYAVLPHSCSCSFCLVNLQEGELCQIYTNTYSSFSKHLEFSQQMNSRRRFQGRNK